MSAPTGSVSKVRAARAAGKRAGLKDIRAIDPTWSSASLAARRRVVTPTGQGQKGSVSRGRRGLPGGAAGLNGGERRRIGTRKPGARLITESDIEPGRPAACGRLGREAVGGSITRGVARDFQFCTAALVVQRSGSGATFVGAVTGLEQQRNSQLR